MDTTATLVELLNKKNLTPLTAPEVLVPFISSHLQELKKRHCLIFIESTERLCVTEAKQFSSHSELVDYHANIPGTKEFLFLSFDGLVFEIAMKTKMICWEHHFDEGSDYQYCYYDNRIVPQKIKFDKKEFIKNLEKWVVDQLLNPDRSN